MFSSVVVVAFYEQNMCRFLSDYVQNKPLSRSMETRRFSPRKKGGGSLSQSKTKKTHVSRSRSSREKVHLLKGGEINKELQVSKTCNTECGG